MATCETIRESVLNLVVRKQGMEHDCLCLFCQGRYYQYPSLPGGQIHIICQLPSPQVSGQWCRLSHGPWATVWLSHCHSGEGEAGGGRGGTRGGSTGEYQVRNGGAQAALSTEDWEGKSNNAKGNKRIPRSSDSCVKSSFPLHYHYCQLWLTHTQIPPLARGGT